MACVKGSPFRFQPPIVSALKPSFRIATRRKSMRGAPVSSFSPAPAWAPTASWPRQANPRRRCGAGRSVSRKPASKGCSRDKTRPPGKPPVAGARGADLVRLTLEPPPHEATHWTARAMAKAVGLGVATVQKIWRAHGLAPHRFRAFKLSNDPAFAEKLHAIVGLYVSPPAHAVVLSVDEKSQIQALDRTQPGLPMKKGRGATMTHDYKRHGTTTLF